MVSGWNSATPTLMNQQERKALLEEERRWWVAPKVVVYLGTGLVIMGLLIGIGADGRARARLAAVP